MTEILSRTHFPCMICGLDDPSPNRRSCSGCRNLRRWQHRTLTRVAAGLVFYLIGVTVLYAVSGPDDPDAASARNMNGQQLENCRMLTSYDDQARVCQTWDDAAFDI